MIDASKQQQLVCELTSWPENENDNTTIENLNSEEKLPANLGM